MRSDVKHLAKCGRESQYFCRTHRDTHCGKHWPRCRYTLHTITSIRDKNPIHPLAIELTQAFATALTDQLLTTAWCIDLARMAIGWELAAQAKGYPDEFAQSKVREKIEKDKGIKIPTY